VLVVAKLVGTLFVLSLVTFLATNAIPGNPAIAAIGHFATPQQIHAFRIQEGLNRPLVVRYVFWLSEFVRGDWGTSIISQQAVRSLVLPRFARTVILALASFFLALPIALSLGVYAGRRAQRPIDRGLSMALLALSALPEFVIGVLLLFVLAVWLRVLPVDSSALAFGGIGLGATVQAYLLPTITLTLVLIPYIARLMRANVREVMREPHIQAAVLQGIRGLRLSARRVAPNAARPVVNVLALNLSELVAGVVVVETVFGFPGAGQLLVNSVESQDVPTVQALVMLIGAMLVIFNLLADLALLVLNPRLRKAGR
jgi:peptide/nickel transport system permease protein